jgi:hypothetical protein
MIRATNTRAALGPLLLLLFLVLLFITHRPPARPRLAPPWAVNVSAEWSDVAEIPLPSLGVTVDEFTEQTDLHVTGAEQVYNADQQQHLTTESEWALAYVSERFGHTPARPVTIAIQQAADCQLNGIAFTGQRQVQVFACPQTARDRVVNVLAHELVHQLAHDYYGDQHLQADMILLEGLATWGSGEYWLSGQPSFRTFVRQNYYETDKLLPLQTSYQGRSIDDMNMLYYEWASFVEYLLEAYGREKFDALYISGAQSPGSADYQGVYGKDLATLEQEWLIWLGDG